MVEAWLTMTAEERLNEAGTEPPCPYCQRPRVRRSVYTRCNPCGKNWMNGVDLSKHPHTKVTELHPTATSGGARTANSTTDD